MKCPAFDLCGSLSYTECPVDSADIAFAIDASSSISEDDFQRQLEFIKDVILGINVKDEGAKCGLLIYSDDAEIMCDLDVSFLKHSFLHCIKILHIALRVHM